MIKSMKRYWKYLLPALPLMFTLTACEEDYTPHQLPESIVMEAIELSYTVEQQNKLYVDNTETMAYPMLSGESVRFDYTTTPDPSEVTFPTVCWTTNNPDVVSIAEDGTITAIGAGNAIVTIAPDTPNLVAQASLKIIVSDELIPATAITISDNAKMVDPINGDTPACYMGETMQLKAAIEPSTTTYKTVKWTSADEAIATVDQVTGLVTGVTRGFVDIIATALDPENPVSATHHIYIDQVVDPLGIKFMNAPAEDYCFPILQRWFTVEFETYPQLSTRSLIKWESSDPSIATVSDGVVTISGYGQVTITAICAEGTIPADQEGFAREVSFKMNIPEGLVREYFLNPKWLTWDVNPSCRNAGAKSEVKFTENGERYLEVTTRRQNDTNQRADFSSVSHTLSGGRKIGIHAGNYPILALRMDDVQKIYSDQVTFRAFKFDTSSDAISDGRSWAGELGNGSDKYDHCYHFSDNSDVFVYDLTVNYPAKGAATLLPTNETVFFSTFQVKYADMRTLTAPVTYRAFWIETFRNMDELKAKMDEDCAKYGHTYTQVK